MNNKNDMKAIMKEWRRAINEAPPEIIGVGSDVEAAGKASQDMQDRGGDSKTNVEALWLAVQMIDPSGISNYPDLVRSWKAYQEAVLDDNVSTADAAALGASFVFNAIASVPLVSLIKKPKIGFQLMSKAEKAADSLKIYPKAKNKAGRAKIAATKAKDKIVKSAKKGAKKAKGISAAATREISETFASLSPEVPGLAKWAAASATLLAPAIAEAAAAGVRGDEDPDDPSNPVVGAIALGILYLIARPIVKGYKQGIKSGYYTKKQAGSKAKLPDTKNPLTMIGQGAGRAKEKIRPTKDPAPFSKEWIEIVDEFDEKLVSKYGSLDAPMSKAAKEVLGNINPNQLQRLRLDFEEILEAAGEKVGKAYDLK